MMVRPVAMSASSTPKARPLKTCDMKRLMPVPPSFAFVMQIWMQPIPAPETMLVSGARTSSGGRAHLATCVVHRRQGLQTVGNGNHVNPIILVLDFRGLLAANGGEVGHPVVVFRTEVDFAAHAVRTLVI